MNQEATKLKLNGSSFSNSHGLSDKANKSTAMDVCRLSNSAMKYPLFREIVNLATHTSSKVFDYNEGTACLVRQRWFNLNYLLKDPNKRYRGIKTGQTPNAGSCLASQFVDESQNLNLLCVVIGTQSNMHRNIETTKLVNWHVARRRASNSWTNNVQPVKTQSRKASRQNSVLVTQAKSLEKRIPTSRPSDKRVHSALKHQTTH